MITRNQSAEIFANIMNCTSKCTGYAVIPSAKIFSEKYQSLMKYLCTFVEHIFENTETLTNDNAYMNIVFCILNIVLNLTDRISLVPVFVHAGYPGFVVKWIEKPPSEYNWPELNEQVITINHNLCRHKEGLNALRKKDAFTILMNYKMQSKWKNDAEWDDVTQLFAMSLIALATNNKEQAKSKDLICHASEKLYSLCEKVNTDVPSLRIGGFHLSELLNSLQWALFNTTVIRHILGNKPNIKKEPIQFFAQLLISFYGTLLNREANDLEKSIGRSLLKIILCISCYHDYREELRKHGQFCILIESLTKRPEQDIPKRIQANLKLDEKPKSSTSSIILNKQQTIYMNYNWKDRNLCASLIQELRKLANIPIWVDYENANYYDDMWDHIAVPLTDATIVIVLVSKPYCNSMINFQELSYATQISETQPECKKDLIIFVEIESNIIHEREWIDNLSKDKMIISFDPNASRKIATKIMEHNVFPSGNPAHSRICSIM